MFRRQHKTRAKIMSTLLAMIGGIVAFFGTRALMRWLRERSYEQPNYYPSDQGMMESGMPGMETTMPGMETTMPGMETTVPDMGTSMPSSNMPMDMSVGRSRMPQEGVTATGKTEVGENYEPVLQDESERAAIPATGMMTGMMEEQVIEHPSGPERGMVETDEPVRVGGLVGSLIVHLLSYHNMMEMLQRRRETAVTSTENQMPDAREGGADAVSSLQAQMPEFDHAALVPGSLQERMVRLMDHIRDTLQNRDYNDDQLFQIREEIRPEACKVLDQIRQVHEDGVTGFEEVRKSYQCG